MSVGPGLAFFGNKAVILRSWLGFRIRACGPSIKFSFIFTCFSFRKPLHIAFSCQAVRNIRNIT